MASDDISKVTVTARIFTKPINRKKTLWENLRGIFKGEPWGFIEIT